MNKAQICLCFDFDGTIADSFWLFAEKLDELAPEFGYEPIGKSEAERLRKKDPALFFASIHIPPDKLPLLVERLREEFGKDMHCLAPFKGIPEVLQILKEQGYRLGLVSANSEENVRAFMRSHQLSVFEFLECGCDLPGKPEALGRRLREMNLRPCDMVYIGDQVRDAQAARDVGIRFGAVSWGFSTIKSLNTFAPDFIFNTPEDIPAAIF
jgi:HAD superfamily hydrolase (TIGR01549 family)